MSKIPTTEEIIEKMTDYWQGGKAQYIEKDVKSAMIEFAKLHVQAALEAASKKAKTKEDIAIFAEGSYKTQVVDKESILKSYPLSNIK